jgi:hypothetical protein
MIHTYLEVENKGDAEQERHESDDCVVVGGVQLGATL